MDYYSFTDPEGMEGWVGLVGWLIADALPTKWSHVNHGSGVDQGKSASYRPTFLPLSHAANVFSQYRTLQLVWWRSSAMRLHLASSPQSPLAYSVAVRHVQVCCHGPPGDVWACYQLLCWRLLPHHQRSPKADGPQTAGLVIQPFRQCSV